VRTIFLDTVGVLATLDTADQWHSAAEQAMTQIRMSKSRFLSTTYVLLECGNAAARTTYRADVHDLREELLAFGNLFSPTLDDERNAWAAYRKGEAGQAGIVDHVSFTVMRRLGITEAFTNDSHFRAAGFTALF
jgi:predicted nucleic acid-binding protein